MTGDPRSRDRDRRDVVLTGQAVDDGVELGVVGRTEEHAGEEAGLEGRPGLDGDVVQAAVVDDATAVEGERLLLGEHVGRDPLRDDRRVGDRELELVGHDRLADVLAQQVDLSRGVVRDAERPHLAGGLELVEGARDLLGLDERVGAVQQQDVDAVGAQSGQRTLDRLEDVLVGEVEVRTLPHDSGLRLDRDLVALRRAQGHRLGKAALATVQLVAVDVGVVEEVDAGIAGCADKRADLVVGLVGNTHQAEHHVGRDDLGSGQGEGLHSRSSRAAFECNQVSLPSTDALRSVGSSRERTAAGVGAADPGSSMVALLYRLRGGGSGMNWRKKMGAVVVALGGLFAAGVAVPSAAFAADSGPWEIVPGSLGAKCVEVAGASTASSAQVQIWGCASFINDVVTPLHQRWTFRDTTNGYKRLVNGKTKLCANIKGSTDVNSTKIVQYKCGSSATLNDQWYPQKVKSIAGYDFYQLKSRLNPAKCLNVQGGGTSNGTD